MTLAELWTAVSTVVTNVLSALSTVGSTILSNVLFQTLFGISVTFIIIAAFRRILNIAR